MIYVGPAWKFARGAYLLKPLSLQNNALRMFGEFQKNVRIRERHVAFEIPYVYDFVTNLCRQQAQSQEVTLMKISVTVEKKKLYK
jgi:hypothetical protein